MAKKVVVELIDDLDGSTLDEEGGTVRFGLGNVNYEIDLSSVNRAKLENLLAPYVEKARVAPQTKRSGRLTGKHSNAAEIRAWAVDRGMDIPARGRLPKPVIEAYESR